MGFDYMSVVFVAFLIVWIFNFSAPSNREDTP
jgi:hypothetical protein